MDQIEIYDSGEIPRINDVVRFSWYSWLHWWLTDRQPMLVLEKGKFESGRDYIVVGWICERSQISKIHTNWNPANFILMERNGIET